MKRLTLFVKGNVDVHDSLHSCRLGGELVWNGINDVLRDRDPKVVARLKHETWTRSDALLLSEGKVPATLAERKLPLGTYPAEMQFSRAIFETKADAIILSIQPDVTTSLMRHRKEGYRLYTSELSQWASQDQQWLKDDFERTEPLDVAASASNLSAIVGKIREQSESPILVYNMSPLVPGETLHCYQGMEETYSTRVRRFNLALIELSEKTGISIVDVDSLLARKGADALKLDPLHLTAAGYRLVAEEVVRILEDVGVLDEEASVYAS